jgi:hypothetical protein
MNHDSRDLVSVVVAAFLTAVSHLNLSDWVQVIVAMCAIGNLLVSVLRWRFPGGR